MLQLLASGFERILKILLLLIQKHLNGAFPDTSRKTNFFSVYGDGHGIDQFLDALLKYSVEVKGMQENIMVAEGLLFLNSNEQFAKFILIITEFAKHGRYYYIDTIVKAKHEGINPFDMFDDFLDSFYLESEERTFEQEDELAIIEAISCIEKGASSIARFFTHGLGELGKSFYSDFAGYLLLKDENLGKLEYANKQIQISDNYMPINSRSPRFLAIRLLSKSSSLNSKQYSNWPFTVDKVKVFYTGGINYLVEINRQVYALTTTTGHYYQIPDYRKSDKLKPKGYAFFLMDEAKKLNKNSI
jgi:hypothetical protein